MFSRRSVIGLALLASLAALMSAPSVALADLMGIIYDADSTKINYTKAGRHFTAVDTGASRLNVRKVNVDDFGKTVDSVRIDDGHFDLKVDMTLTKVSANVYTAVGTFWFTDTSTGSHAAESSFVSTSIRIENAELVIEGLLTGGPFGGGNEILNPNRGDPTWTFTGEEIIPDGSPDENSTPTTFDIQNRSTYDVGSLQTLRVLASSASLDELFDGDEHVELLGAKVEGSIIPAPGAALLAVMGLGMVAWVRKRKHS